MSRRWQELKCEPYRRMARHAGYRSRAAYKLRQLDDRYNLFKRGHVVVDLGAAPGGWMQVAQERVGSEGFMLGIDLQPIARLPYENVKTFVADVTDETTPELIRKNIPYKADVVLSDLSPKITGVWNIDHERSIDLARRALTIAERTLRAGGKFVVKVFQGKTFDELVAEIRMKFDFVKVSKPQASRKGSAEVYIIANGFKIS